MQDSVYHWTSHHAGQRVSLDVTPCRTASITGCHTMQNSHITVDCALSVTITHVINTQTVFDTLGQKAT